MYVVVILDRRTEPTDDSLRVREQFVDVLGSLSWVKPLSGDFFLVRIESGQLRDELRRRLVEVCKANPGSYHLLVSPALEDGTWSGWLPKEMWDKVKARTRGPAE